MKIRITRRSHAGEVVHLADRDLTELGQAFSVKRPGTDANLVRVSRTADGIELELQAPPKLEDIRDKVRSVQEMVDRLGRRGRYGN